MVDDWIGSKRLTNSFKLVMKTVRFDANIAVIFSHSVLQVELLIFRSANFPSFNWAQMCKYVAGALPAEWCKSNRLFWFFNFAIPCVCVATATTIPTSGDFHFPQYSLWQSSADLSTCAASRLCWHRPYAMISVANCVLFFMMASIHTHATKPTGCIHFIFLLFLSNIKSNRKKAQERHNKAHKTKYEYLLLSSSTLSSFRM